MALQVDVALTLNGYLASTVEGADANYPLTSTLSERIASGTTAGKADDAFVDRAASFGTSGTTYDLSGSSNKNPFQANLGFVEIVCIIVEADAANTADLIVGAAASNQFLGPLGDAADTFAVKPGGRAFFYCAQSDPGWAVAGGSTDSLKIAAASGTQVGTLILIGRKS